MRVKVLSVGSAGVGKSCLIKRFCEHRFVDKYVQTVGVDFGVTSFTSSKQIAARMQLFDLGGHPDYAEIRCEFWAQTQAALVVFDVTSRDSFRALNGWIQELQFANTQPLTIAVCANKIDRPGRQVSEGEARLWAESNGFLYYETSALSGDNVDDMFASLFNEAIELTMCVNAGKQVARKSGPSFSLQDLHAIERIKSAQTSHERLGVTSNASVDEIKKSYRRLAALLHPDKNRAPGSEEAFKLLASARDSLLGLEVQ